MLAPIEIFSAAPPISRTLAAVVLSLSVVLHIGILPVDRFDLSVQALIQFPPELWRIFTSLLITGPNLAILFDTYLLYVYGAKLEIASPRFSQRADFVTYICFISGLILLLNILVTFGTIFAGVLALAFVTTAVRDMWDQPITFIVLKMPAQYLPWMFLFLILIMAGPQVAMIHATGVAAAYIYDLCTGLYPNFGIKRNLIPTPGFIKKIFGTQNVIERPYGMVSTGAVDEPAWGLDLSWKKFGPGRTLGGEGAGASRQRPKGLVLTALVVGGFVVICGLLGYLFLIHGAPDMWFPGWFSSVDISKLSNKDVS